MQVSGFGIQIHFQKDCFYFTVGKNGRMDKDESLYSKDSRVNMKLLTILTGRKEFLLPKLAPPPRFCKNFFQFILLGNSRKNFECEVVYFQLGFADR